MLFYFFILLISDILTLSFFSLFFLITFDIISSIIVRIIINVDYIKFKLKYFVMITKIIVSIAEAITI